MKLGWYEKLSEFEYIKTVSTVSIVLAIIATILVIAFIVPERNANSKNKVLVSLHNLVNFKSLLIEKILQALYIFSTINCIIYGFLTIFSSEEIYINGEDVWVGWFGFLILILGPILIRVVYEGLMLLVLLVKNVIDIRKKLYNNPENDSSYPTFFQPKSTSVPNLFSSNASAKSTPQERWVCPHCASSNNSSNQYCTVCGSKKPITVKSPSQAAQRQVSQRQVSQQQVSQQQAAPSQAAQPQVAQQQTPGPYEWKCPRCGRINQNYVSTCGCGEQRPIR